MDCSVSIIIPVHNKCELTIACLESLALYSDTDTFEILIIDNASSDDTPERCKNIGTSLFGDRFRYIRLESNINFGPACTFGATEAKGRLVFFLNNDTLLTAGWLEPLLDALGTDPGLGAVGPLLLYPDEQRVQHLGVAFTPDGSVDHLYEYFPANHPLVMQKRSLQALTAAALMLPRELFLQCGGFYPEYRNGFEDLDLSLTLRAKGWRLTCEPASRIIHIGGQTPGRFDNDEHNALVLAERWPDIRPDLHELAQDDGYDFAVTSWLDSRPVLKAERANELNELLSKCKDWRELWSWLQREPLWEQGYVLLGDLLEQHRLWSEALECRSLQCTLCPSLGAYKARLLAAIRAGATNVVKETEDALQSIERFMGNTVRYNSKLLAIHRRLERHALNSLSEKYPAKPD
jgi:GT2 family glycosyltransferase